MLPNELNIMVNFLFFTVFFYVSNIIAGGISNTCDSDNCLHVQPDSKFCSIDPYVLDEKYIFPAKMQINIDEGLYPIKKDNTITDFPLTITIGDNAIALKPSGGISSVIKHTKADEGTNTPETETLKIVSRYIGKDVTIDKFLLKTSRNNTFIDFTLPNDIESFYAHRHNLLVNISETKHLLLDAYNKTIFFSPCSMRGIPESKFYFKFIDESELMLDVRAFNGSHEIGYYIGRLISVEGEFNNKPITVTSHNDLAFIGSTLTQGEMTTPTLAIRTKINNEICGLIFDSSQWEASFAVNGYIAYTMNCDGTKGNAIKLKSASYPSYFVMP